MAPFSRELAVNAIETAFGRPIDTLFVSFGEPVAAASIAQVHRARVRDRRGEREVAVKVLRPGVERRFRRDLSDMYFAAWIAERWFPETKRLKPVEVVDTLARTVKIEMDFRLEAAAASEFAENTAGESDFLRAARRLGPHREGSFDARMDRGHRLVRHGRARRGRP